MNNKLHKPTTYIVKIWDENDNYIKEETYPMHLYSLENVFEILKGKEERCDIYEGRYLKKRGKYVTTALTYFWDKCQWAIQK